MKPTFRRCALCAKPLKLKERVVIKNVNAICTPCGYKPTEELEVVHSNCEIHAYVVNNPW